MNILHLSDTHGAHRSLGRLPEADVIVHSGDIAMNGSSSEALDFMRWFSALPYAHKIFVAGNHDGTISLLRSDVNQTVFELRFR